MFYYLLRRKAEQICSTCDIYCVARDKFKFDEKRHSGVVHIVEKKHIRSHLTCVQTGDRFCQTFNTWLLIYHTFNCI